MSNRMQYGFVDLYGGQWKDCFVDDYNRMSDEIDVKERARMNVEWLKDARHKCFVGVAEMYLAERKKAA